MKPDIGHIRVFGCIVHMRTPGSQVMKLYDRSIQVINLGKEPGTKGYRLYDPNNKRIYISRDVVFEETKCWSWDTEKEVEISQEESFIVPDLHSIETESMGQSYSPQNGVDNGEVTTPRSTSRENSSDEERYDDSTTPKRFRSITDIYNATEEIELEDELILMGIDEPNSFKHAVKDRVWKQAMKSEMESIYRK